MIRIIDAGRLFSRRSHVPAGVPWVYAGSHYRVHSRLVRELGAEGEIPFRETLSTTAYALKDDYITFIGDLNCRRTDLDWHLSSLAEKNMFISPAFGTICILAAVRTLLQGRSDPEILVVCDTPAMAAYLQEMADGVPAGTHVPPGWRVLLRHLPKAVAARVAFVALGAYRRLVASALLGRQRPAGRYALLSFAYASSFRGGYSDVIFGPLIPWLEGRGWGPAIIPLVVPPASYLHAIRGMRASGKTFLVPELHEPFGRRTLHACSTLLHPPARLPPLLFHGIAVDGILWADLVRDWAGRRALESRILGDSLGRITAGGAFRAVAYPFENHVWEKAVCRAVRSVSGETELVGFQHSTIQSMLLNHFIAPCELGLPYLPHRIITSGSRAYDLLRHSGYPEGMVVMGGAVRFLRRGGDAVPHDRGEGPFTVMVAATVDPDESVELISLVLGACRDMAGIRIVIRCHPDLPFDRIAPLLDKGLPPHATAPPGDTVPLHDADVLVFSSTSVAVEALAAGVPVIRTQTMDPLAGNRFEGIAPSRMLQSARTALELRTRVDALRAEPITPGDLREAGELVKLFFGPVDDGVYALFLPGGREQGSPDPGRAD